MGTNHTTNRLTEAKIKGRLDPGRYPDGGNLYLLVGPTGARSWLLRLTIQGAERGANGKLKRRDLGLGALRHVPLAEAREIARQ